MKKALSPNPWTCPVRECSAQSIEEVFTRLESSLVGLSNDEAQRRLRLIGENRLPSKAPLGFIKRLFEQLTSPLILILLGVAVLAPFLGHANDAFIIFVVLAFNTTLGMIQEGRASHALEVLKKSFTSNCSVRRQGLTVEIPTHQLTIGDIVVLHEGNLIPADGRFVQTSGLRVNESMLTGEALPVEKTAESFSLKGKVPLADIKNAGYCQSMVVAGQGLMVVSAIGGQTEVGQIARDLSGQQTEPPLARKVRILSKKIAFTVLIFSAGLYIFGLIAGRPALTLFATVVSLAVSIIPEGLPIVLTLVLARGVSHMASKNAIVKKLNAVEGLGQIQVICTDKTGTLTTNELVIQKVHALDLEALAQGAGLFSRDSLKQGEEAALNAFSLKHGQPQTGWTLIEEQPFSSLTKQRASRWFNGDEHVAYRIGSPESILTKCVNCSVDETSKIVSSYAKTGLRVLALSKRNGDIGLDQEGPWKLIGLVGMGDTLRPGVTESIEWCHEQGIRVVMITGDHPETALAIAREAGIADLESEILNGPELEALSDQELADRINSIRVFSRIAPTHKLRIINAYRQKGLLTAMTGDGVNDAPALHRADVGIAMGKAGTDVAREAAHLVLLDDNFSTIVTAIQEGRAIVSNVRRVITYLFSTNLAEAGMITATLLLNLPLPLLPAQIIWINLITDSFLDVSLGLEPRHGSAHASGGALVDKKSISRVLLLGSTMGIGAFVVYSVVLDREAAYYQTMALTALAAFQWFNAWNARSETRSLFQLSPFSNPYLIGATAMVVGLQIFAIYSPAMQKILGTTPLAFGDWGLIISFSLTILLVDEIWKKATQRELALPARQAAI